MIKRRYLTLMEIMIVIVLIGLIGGVVAYNLRGSLDKGKEFKTRHGGAQVYNILSLEVATGVPIEEVVHDWPTRVESSGLAKNPQELCRDGWGQEYKVQVRGDDIVVTSEKYSAIMRKKGLKGEELYLR